MQYEKDIQILDYNQLEVLDSLCAEELGSLQNDEHSSISLLKQITWSICMENMTEKFSKPFTIKTGDCPLFLEKQARIQVVKDTAANKLQIFLQPEEAEIMHSNGHQVKGEFRNQKGSSELGETSELMESRTGNWLSKPSSML